MNTTCYAYLIIQAFMLPLTHAGAVRRVVLVYKDWLQVCTHHMYALKFVFVDLSESKSD